MKVERSLVMWTVRPVTVEMAMGCDRPVAGKADGRWGVCGCHLVS